MLLWGKGVYPYEYMDSWEKFNKKALPPKQAFYSALNQKILPMKTMRAHKKYGKYLE